MSEHKTSICNLSEKSCKPCEGGIPAIGRQEAGKLLGELSREWELSDDGTIISRDFKFKGFYKTIAFVNALAWIANKENHHPDLEVGYDHCLVKFTTHAINGLTENDFICAARIDALNP
ncbi:MAG: 4a-hydroxytetrahydrobiopterin dehydratase [Gammaproteobacteria bacterium]|nr:4a-hydroxytetrahydrobiopterin dehydratase [Gammaproteobacteria bacterium]